jgi:hypothetical protein
MNEKGMEIFLVPQPRRHSMLAWSSNLVCAVCPASKIYRQHPPLIETQEPKGRLNQTINSRKEREDTKQVTNREHVK